MNLGLQSWGEAGSVVVSAVGVYLGFLVLVRLAGQRLLSAAGLGDLAAALALGAIMGRTILGYTPTLTAGLLGMATLLVMHTTYTLARRSPRFGRLLSRPPILLVADGRVLHDNLRRARMREDDLRHKLRQASVRRYDEVAAAVLEPTGGLSVLRRGEPIAAELLADVEGRHLLQDRHTPRPEGPSGAPAA
jgi:uncharacterized membrane protein YcaP (DUF421 family)